MKIGIDLGGTKIEGIVLGNQGNIHQRRRIATPRGSYEDIIRTLGEFIDSLDPDKTCSIGIGTPGSESPHTGYIRGANTTELNGKPFSADLARHISRPIRIENDANCFALSEAIDGAGKGERNVFGVIIGTGTGGGLIHGGEVVSGRNRIAGEWGHNPLPWPTKQEYPGPLCYCGKNGCLETYLSGPGFSRSYFEKTQTQLSSVQIMEKVVAQEPHAMEVFHNYTHQLARGLSQVINIYDPDIIVLGGGMSNITELYSRVPQLLPQYCFAETITTKIVQAQHGDSSGVRGAAWLWGR